MLFECSLGPGKHKPRARLLSSVHLCAAFRPRGIQIGLAFSVEIYHGTRYKCE